MGLHICYELRLPGETTDEDAVRLLEAFRVHALTLGVASTSPVSRLTALHDAVSPHHRAEGAIFEHPDFERLETERLESRTKLEGK